MEEGFPVIGGYRIDLNADRIDLIGFPYNILSGLIGGKHTRFINQVT